jgi:hypothetical protein
MLIARRLGVATLVRRALWTASAARAGNSSGEAHMLDTRLVAQETGSPPEAINDTAARWNVWGTDLGHMFEHRGRIHMVFGDTLGPPGHPDLPSEDWRSNTMAISSDTNPDDGLLFDDMITDAAGHAKELLSSAKVRHDELTVIPTSGTAVGSRIFLHYMSVREFDEKGFGTWTTKYSGLAYSDDDGNQWTKAPSPRWGPGSNFSQAAMVNHEGHTYLFGIPAGRRGGVKLARVPSGSLLDPSAYRYWNAAGWAPSEVDASLIVAGPVGELSVRWNSHYAKWLVMYLRVDRDAIVLRTADALTGPWEDERVVASGRDYPMLYLGSIAPKWNDGPDIWFTMTMHRSYNVFWMRTSLCSGR